MTKNVTRALAMVLMMIATIGPATIAAQDATPAASPLATPVGGPGLTEAVTWLIDQQQEDGSWLGFSGEPDAGTTIDAVIALAAAGEAGVDVEAPISLALDFLGSEDVAATYVEVGTGQAAKLVLALVAAGADSMEIGGVAPLDLVVAGQDGETGMFGGGIYDHAYALMALAATDTEVPANAIEYLTTTQAMNGGYSFDGSTDETMVDSNTTAMVVQALVAVGEGDSPVTAGAVGYLRTVETSQGASYSVGAEADANSTALVAQALIAVDEDATHYITALAHFQNSNGAFHWMHSDPADNSFTTIQVIPALAGEALPVVPAVVAWAWAA